MPKIPVTPQNIKIAKKFFDEGLDGKYPPFIQCFEATTTVQSKHELIDEYISKTACEIPKEFVSIAMDQTFGVPKEKDDKGALGYKLKCML